MLKKRKVFIAPAFSKDNGNGDAVRGYDPPHEALASVYPITSGQEAQFYGVKPDESFRLVLPWDAAIHNGDGVWLDEVAGEKPPFEVISSPSWMLTIQAVIKKVI